MAIKRSTTEYSYEGFRKVIYIKGKYKISAQWLLFPCLIFFQLFQKFEKNCLKQNENLYLQDPEGECSK